MNDDLAARITSILAPAIRAALALALEEERAREITNSTGHLRAIQDGGQAEEYLTVKQLAARLHKKPRTIYDLVSKGLIPYRKPAGGGLLFERREIEEWTKSRINT